MQSVIFVECMIFLRRCHPKLMLNFGQKIAEDIPTQIQKNKMVQEAYLGVSEGADD